LLNSPRAHILQSTIMTEVFKQISFKPFLILIEKNDKIIGGLMSYIWFGNSKVPIVKIFSRLYSYYGPIFSSIETNPTPLKEILWCVSQEVDRRPIMDHRISFIPYMEVNNILKALGYSQIQPSLRYTFIVGLRKSTQELWKSLEKRCRNAIRKAESRGLRIVEGSRTNTPKIFHWLHLNTAKRLAIPPNPYSFTETIWKILVPKGHAKFFFAYYKEHPIAGSLIIRFKKKMYYYMSASLKEYWDLYPNNLLQWHIILDGKSNGYESYDLMGSPGEDEKDHPEYGLYLFKKSFGGEMTRIGASYLKVLSPCTLRIWDRVLTPAFKRLSFISEHL